MTPINALTVGIPSFFLAFRPLYDKPKGRFLVNILENAAPAALTIVFNIIVIRLIGNLFDLPQAEISTMNVLLTAVIGFFLLYRVSKPLRGLEKVLIAVLAAAFLACVIWLGWFIGYEGVFGRNIFFYLPLLIISPRVFGYLSDKVHELTVLYDAWEKKQGAVKEF